MLCKLALVSVLAVLLIGSAVRVAIPMGRANAFVVKRAILAITAITIVLEVGVIIDGVKLKKVLAGESAHIQERGIIECLSEKNGSILLAPKPDSAGKKLLGVGAGTQ